MLQKKHQAGQAIDLTPMREGADEGDGTCFFAFDAPHSWNMAVGFFFIGFVGFFELFEAYFFRFLEGCLHFLAKV